MSEEKIEEKAVEDESFEEEVDEEVEKKLMKKKKNILNRTEDKKPLKYPNKVYFLIEN